MSQKALEAIRTQVMWNRLVAVVEEQAQSLLRTAFGTITREAGDLSAGVFDRQGRRRDRLLPPERPRDDACRTLSP